MIEVDRVGDMTGVANNLASVVGDIANVVSGIANVVGDIANVWGHLGHVVDHLGHVVTRNRRRLRVKRILRETIPSRSAHGNRKMGVCQVRMGMGSRLFLGLGHGIHDGLRQVENR